ncbi:CLUMA_CG009153, isoform A [Clunio marinus]|uniref:CLUMA_CG009153, isoform A n=1 Tax=Clunio marinus TaxID=568069 RepID=A0A1J1I5T9_9DIPT|nr:CLUMA_CG009153, isoform A [Clunio marinus]
MYTRFDTRKFHLTAKWQFVLVLLHLINRECDLKALKTISGQQICLISFNTAFAFTDFLKKIIRFNY